MISRQQEPEKKNEEEDYQPTYYFGSEPTLTMDSEGKETNTTSGRSASLTTNGKSHKTARLTADDKPTSPTSDSDYHDIVFNNELPPDVVPKYDSTHPASYNVSNCDVMGNDVGEHVVSSGVVDSTDDIYYNEKNNVRFPGHAPLNSMNRLFASSSSFENPTFGAHS